MKTRSGRQASQQPLELRAFIEILKLHRVRSYLEIGARHGDTFYEVMRSLPRGSRGMAVDMPLGPWGSDSKGSLTEACQDLIGRGYNVQALFGNSRDVVPHVDPEYDAVFIDADHRYDAVKADWEIYGSRARIVAFHDIDGEGMFCNEMPVEVPRLWNEIKDGYEHYEFISPSDKRRMGIGVICK